MLDSVTWAEELYALFNIILIDLVLAGDNAIVIGMAASRVDPEIRKKVIAFGIGGAVVIRVILALLATWILAITGLLLAGGLLLLWVCWKMYREIRQSVPTPVSQEYSTKLESPHSGFLNAVITIVIADLSMSLDNVLAVAGAAKGNAGLLIVGLAISILAMAVASNYIAKLLTRFPWIMWLGLLIILTVALEMIYEGGAEVGCVLSLASTCIHGAG